MMQQLKAKLVYISGPKLGSIWEDGQVTCYSGYPLGNKSYTTSDGWADQDNYTICKCMLGANALTSILDASYIYIYI